MAPPNDADREKVLWCGNLHESVTEEILYELFLQAGPLESVKIVPSKERGGKSYAFVTFKHAVSVPFTLELMCGIQLYSRPLQLQMRSASSPQGSSVPSTPDTPNIMDNGMAVPSPTPLSRVLSYGGSPMAMGHPEGRSSYQRWNSEPDRQNTLKADQYGYGNAGGALSRQDSRSMTPQTKPTPSRNGSNWSSGGGSRGGDHSESLSTIVSEQLQLIRQSPQMQPFKQSPQLQQVFRQSPQHQQQQQHRHSPQQYGESPYYIPQQMSGGHHSSSGGAGTGGSWTQQPRAGYHPYGGSGNGREQHRRR